MSKKRSVRAPDSITAIRLRWGQFIGDNSTCDHLIHECIDNFFDEIRNGYGKQAGLNINNNTGVITVYDTGRGLPMGTTIDESTGKEIDSIEILFTRLYAGTKFSYDDDNLDTLFGQNGVGLKTVNALSEYVTVLTKDKDKNVWQYKFVDGKLESKNIIDKKMLWSTAISFKPSKEHFTSTIASSDIFYERLQLAQAKIVGSEFYFNNKRVEEINLEEFVRRKLKLQTETPLYSLSYSTKIDINDKATGKKYSKPAKLTGYITYEENDPIVIGDANLRLCDGKYLDVFQSLIKNIAIKKLDKKYSKVSPRFLVDGLKLYISLDIPNPTFDSQTKTRLTTDLKDDLISPIENKLLKIFGEEYILSTLSTILDRKMSNKIRGTKTKTKISYDNKLVDCLNKPGKRLMLVEGDSAGSVIRDARDEYNDAYLPLRGKVINVETNSFDKIDKNKELTNLKEAIGNYPNWRYEEIQIVTDGDCDYKNTLIFYESVNGEYKFDYIENIKDIKNILSFNSLTGKYEKKPVINKIEKESDHDFYEIETYGCEKICATSTHGWPVYDIKEKNIKMIVSQDLDPKNHLFIAPKTGQKQLIENKTQYISIKDTFFNLLNKKCNKIRVNRNNKQVLFKELNKFEDDDEVYYNNDLISFNQVIDEDIAFLIGYYLGDGYHGSSKKNPYTIEFACGNTLRNIDKLIDACKKHNYKYYIDKHKSKSCVFIIKSPIFTAIIDALGLTRDIKADTKFIPTIIYKSPISVIKQFICGYLSADGSYVNDRGTQKISITTISPKLAYGISILFNLFGVYPRVQEQEPKIGGINSRGVQIVGKHRRYDVTISNRLDLISDICAYLTKDKIIKKRRRNRYIIDLTDEYIGLKIKSVKNVGKKDKAYCFTVADNHTFTVGLNNITTFNCDGHHIVCLIILMLYKYWPKLIEEGKLSVVLPPLYGAIKGNQFIPLYKIEQTEPYRKKGYQIRRFKGLGEMQAKQMKVVLDNPLKYIIEMPTKEIANQLIKIITDSEEKRKYMNMDRYSFDVFMQKLSKSL